MHVLITGATRGIGAGLLAAFRDRGDQATGTARDGRPGFLAMDVRDPASVRAAAAGLQGPLDLLVCNAGIYPDSGHRLEGGFAPDLWAEAFAVNVTGVFLTVQAVLPHLARAPAPKIAIIASRMGSSTRAPGGSYIYRASKAAAVNLGRNLATDLRPSAIAVGIYHPGWVKTDMGGTGAEISIPDSARRLLARFDALSLATTGVFEDCDGDPIAF